MLYSETALLAEHQSLIKGPFWDPHTGGAPRTSHKLTVNGFTQKNTLLETGQRSWLGSYCHMKEGDLSQSSRVFETKRLHLIFNWFIDSFTVGSFLCTCSVFFLCKVLCCFSYQIEQITSYIVKSVVIDPARRAKLAMHMMALFATTLL